MSLFQQVQEAIAQTLRVSPSSITESTRARDVPAWDSLAHVNLMMTLEQHFDIQFEVEDLPKLDSVPAIMEYLRARGFA
jgi:acyl carrier protein